MSFIKKGLVFVLLFLLVGCSTKVKDENQEPINTNEKINLNIHQSDLIASITDNEKYLNKDLFHSIDMLEDDDLVNVIISLKSNGIVDNYNENNLGYNTLNEYATSRHATSNVKAMNAEQQAMINSLIELGYINEVKHNFTTLFNGFSATTTYGKLKKLEN